MVLDPTFMVETFKTKVDHIFVMLHMGLMTDNMKSVRHFISDAVYKKFSDRLTILNRNNERQMFDELNIKSTDIVNVEIEKDKYIIKVRLISKYLDYVVDKTTNKIKRGDNKTRKELENILILEKRRDTKIQSIVRFCSNCGHSIDVNKSGYCEYCHSTYNQDAYDWVLVSILSR